MALRPFGLGRAPLTGNSALDRYLEDVRAALNGLPFSFFSTANGPNASAVTAPVGTIGIELGSAMTKLWFKEGPSSTTGWVSVRTV